jgi:hypothetical protein
LGLHCLRVCYVMAIISRYDPRTRYRAKAQRKMSLLAGLGLTGIVCAVVGYGVGYQFARMDERSLNTELVTLTAERDKLQQTVTRLMADSHSANLKFQQIEEHLQSELPQDGPLKDIVAQIREQLDAGVSPDRLASVIRTLSPPQNCTDPETRRFIVETTKNKNADHSMILAEGAIVIRAVGEAAKSKTGEDEAWFDPTRPVALTFGPRGGDPQSVITRNAILPLSQVMVVDGREYRMTFSEGAKSFLKVTYESCDYP